MKKITAILLCLMPLIAFSGPPTSLMTCVACHGKTGESSIPGTPDLWGNSASYLAKQLKDYKNKSYNNGTMSAMTISLSEKDIQELAEYYASQPMQLKYKLVWRGDKWPGDMDLGERIAYVGKWENKVPACVTCHGPNGVGVKPTFPRLGGQDKTYLINQMNAWKNNNRPAGELEVMPLIAKALTKEEIEAVAEYFSQQGEKE